MLQRHIHVRTDFFLRPDRFEKFAGDLVGISIEEPNPPQIFDLRQFLEQEGESIFQAEVFAVASRVLPDESDFPYAYLCQSLSFGDHRFEAPGAKLPPQLRDDAERAGMIAALRNFDIGSGFRSSQNSGSLFVI